MVKQFRKIFTVLILIILALTVSACQPTPSSGPYTIEISGTSGTEFMGSIGAAGSSKSVEGIVPETYTVSGWPAVAVIQKKEESGFISVTIKENGQTLDSQSTSASYGVVTVHS